MNFPFNPAPFDRAALLVSGLALTVACVLDLRSRRIPNALNLSLALALLALHVAGAGWVGALAAGEAFTLTFAVAFALFAAGAFGGGDAKLLAALSLGLGFTDAFWLCVYMGLAGGALGITRLLADGQFTNALFGLLSKERREAAKKSTVPYALAIAAGWAVLVWQRLSL